MHELCGGHALHILLLLYLWINPESFYLLSARVKLVLGLLPSRLFSSTNNINLKSNAQSKASKLNRSVSKTPPSSNKTHTFSVLESAVKLLWSSIDSESCNLGPSLSSLLQHDDALPELRKEGAGLKYFQLFVWSLARELIVRLGKHIFLTAVFCPGGAFTV